VSKNVLFLSPGNAGRSIIAESLLNHWGKDRFVGHSAGQFPQTAVHPLALTVLNERLLPTEGLRSKSWDTFAQPGAPEMDYIFAICDSAHGETFPEWPDHPTTAKWEQADPAAAAGTYTTRLIAFRSATRALEAKIRQFLK
jgi:protein-tyrosine-phosphatase